MTDYILDDNQRIPGILKKLDIYKFNPAGIQRVVLQHLKDVTENKVDVVDATNPFVFCLEASAVTTAAFMVANEALNRKQYSAAAQTPEDIYLHMSDKDFINRFASPAVTVFSLLIQKEDLLQKMVFDPVTLGKKITIPRNTEFTVADTTFSLQYPIDIKQLTHGGLQAVYDTSLVSPLQVLNTNAITIENRTLSGAEFIYLEFEVYQFRINSITPSITPATGFSQNISISDQYYYTRVYFKNTANGIWKEIYTTHTDQVYDPLKPTAVLKLIDKTLNVSIPQIYLNTNLIQGTLRIDVYETKGFINMVMTNFASGAFSAIWRNIDKSYETIFTAVMSTLTALPYSYKTIVGGSDSLSFEQLRTRVINNSTGDKSPPITNVEIASKLEKKGYGIVTNVDLITNRVFLATRQLPKPINEKLITAASSSIETFIISVNEAAALDGALENDNRVTLTPSIIYRNVNGIISVVPQAEINNLLLLSPKEIAIDVTNNQYLYTPFHYVLDQTGNQFEVRPYYLDTPTVKTIQFVKQNDSTGLQINTNEYAITNTRTGYKLIIVTKSNESVKDLDNDEIFVQLSYVPSYENRRAYLNGTYVGRTIENERKFEFDLSTNYDIDSSDNLILTKFKMFVNSIKLTGSFLENSFDILYSTNGSVSPTLVYSEIDSLLGKFILPTGTVGVTQEKIFLKFGDSLKTLWARSRSVVFEGTFQKHTTNIPWLYIEDVYATDVTTGSKFSIDNGNIVYTKLHSLGDPVLDSLGQPTYRYKVDDNVLDSYGDPIPISGSKILRQIDMMFIEGVYAFANDVSAETYKTSSISTVVSWLTGELALLNQELLEQSKLFFYPKTTMGNIQVLTDGGLVADIQAGQSLTINLFVSKSVYTNSELRQSLVRTTINTIDSIFQDKIISTSKIITQLQEKYGSDVISLNVNGLGGSQNMSTLTIVNEGQRCNIRKKLVNQPDNTLIVSEDITINFVTHQV